MSNEELDDTDFEDMEMDDNDTELETGRSGNPSIDARRRLEARLEEEQLKRQLNDYDFDLDD
ncbi:MAG: hypothetical protein OIF34_09140 [Porticoccaceae bacterium]|nr:hypothetical protein [Porticoccaceae bacterium]